MCLCEYVLGRGNSKNLLTQQSHRHFIQVVQFSRFCMVNGVVQIVRRSNTIIVFVNVYDNLLLL